jgi:hypothetical protein
MPTENDPQRQDPQKQDPKPQDGTSPKASTPAAPTPGGLNFNTRLFDGDLSGSVTQPAPNKYEGIASYLFKNGDTLGANALLGTRPLSIEQYGLNGSFGIGNGGTAQFGFEAAPPKDTYKWLTDIKFGDGSLFNADLTKTAQGDIFKANGLWKIDKDQQLGGSAEFNGVDKFKDLNLKWNHTDQHFFNIGLNNTTAGNILKGDGQATLSPGELLAGKFNLNGVDNTKAFDLRWTKDEGKHFAHVDYNSSPAGRILGGDGQATLSPGELLTGKFNLNGVDNTKALGLGWTKDDGKHFANLDYSSSPAGRILGGDGQATLSPGELLAGKFNLNGVDNTKAFDLRWTKDEGKHFAHVDYSSSPAGRILGGDGQATLSPGELLTGKFKLDGVDNTKAFDLRWTKDEGKHFAHVDYSSSPAGRILGGDGQTTLSPGELLTGKFNLNGVDNTKALGLGWTKDDGKHFANLDYNSSPAGRILGGDGQATLSPGELLTGKFKLDGVDKTKTFGLGWNDNDKHLANLSFDNSLAGNVFKLDGKTTFASGNALTGGLQFNTIDKSKEYMLGYSTLGGSKLDLNLKNLDVGTIFNADAKWAINQKDYLTGNLVLNGVDHTKDLKLGANIKDNLYNFNLGKSDLGTSVGGGAHFGFNDGKGRVGIDGAYGPKLLDAERKMSAEAIGSISYKSKDLEYTGNVKFNNENRGFGLADVGLKLSKGDDRLNYSLEASVNPRSGEYKVMAGISINFGGGGSSRSSHRSSTSASDFAHAMPADPIADFKQKQSVAFDRQAIEKLGQHDRALFDQAKAGVEKLNAKGANLDVDKTAMYLAARANEKGFAKIELVDFGNKTSDGRQNLFIYDREPTHPLVKAAPADPVVASNTPVRASADVLQRTPDIIAAPTESGPKR